MNSLVKWKENIRDAVNIKYKHIFENSFSYYIRKDREARDLVVCCKIKLPNIAK